MEDLTEALQAAQSGLRRDVQRLVDATAGGILYLPLARSMKAPLGEERVTPVAMHLLHDPQGRRAVALFTREEFLSKAGSHFGWRTDDRPLQLAGLRARDALNLALPLVDGEKVRTLVINAFQPSCLELSVSELKAIAGGKALPLVGYVPRTPVQKGEQFNVGEPALPPSPDLVRALQGFIAANPETSGFDLVQMFNPERDLEPHLTLNIRTRGRNPNPQALVDKVNESIRGKLAPPGFLDIMFDPPLK